MSAPLGGWIAYEKKVWQPFAESMVKNRRDTGVVSERAGESLAT
jgi:hypothetical protein